MPSRSPSQARLMVAVAHGWHKPGGGGPSVSVAKEYASAYARKHSAESVTAKAIRRRKQAPTGDSEDCP